MAKLPIAEFLEARLKEYDPTFEVRKGTAFEQLFFKPMQFIIQPLRDESDFIQLSQSFRRILLTTDPNAFNEEAVDSLAANLFVTRDSGQVSAGVARVYYSDPVAREWAANSAIFTGSNSKTYSNPAPFAITREEMGSQIDGGLFYADIPVQSTALGEGNDLPASGLVSLASDTDVITVTNTLPIKGGRAKETNTELINRVKSSISVRDLVTGKGFNAILSQNFPTYISELQAVGFGDKEMMRDIVFNTHIGGKIDGFFTPPTISQGSKNFVGLTIDTTRQTFTSTNLELTDTDHVSVGYPNIDRSNNLLPVVQQVKVSTPASYTSTVAMASPVNLSSASYVSITIDGVTKTINLAGVTPGATTRNEMVNLINFSFGVKVAFYFGDKIKLTSPTSGLTSEVVLDNPASRPSALLSIFGLAPGGAPYTFSGDGPITFTEETHYNFVDEDGTLQRVVGANVAGSPSNPYSSGAAVALTNTFTDLTASVFSLVDVNDILTIKSGLNAGDYRILAKPTPNTLTVDTAFTASQTGVSYYISRTGIKNHEIVFVQFYFNPLSIDIGAMVKLDADGKTRGIRPDRADQTITDQAFLRVNSIEIIDPLTFESIGETLSGLGGYGVGGYGSGPFGIGSGRDYYLAVNSPEERFSMFEDSYIVIDSGFQGFSLRVNYDYAPECGALHDFVRSETERVLDGDILMRHFLPAYVSGTIQYSIDRTDSSIPDNAALTEVVKKFINLRKVGTTLTYSEIAQFIIRVTDPYDRFGTAVKNFTLTARIHNTDGTETVITGDNSLTVPTLDPFPKYTTAPLSPKIAHWVADQIILQRVD